MLEYLNMVNESNGYKTDVLFSLAQGLAHFGELEPAYAHVVHLMEIFPFSERNHNFVRILLTSLIKNIKGRSLMI